MRYLLNQQISTMCHVILPWRHQALEACSRATVKELSTHRGDWRIPAKENTSAHLYIFWRKEKWTQQLCKSYSALPEWFNYVFKQTKSWWTEENQFDFIPHRSFFDVRPRFPPVFIWIHFKQNTQHTSQTWRLLFQQVRLGLPLKTFNQKARNE